MKRIRISYSPNLSEIGTVREVEDADAATAVADGRAVVVEDEARLVELSKADLLTRAGEVGADVSERDSKDTIAAAITAAESGQG
jgi:hypothetical protein